MKKNIYLILGLLFLNISIGQEIEMKLNLLGYKFVQNGERLTWNDLEQVIASNHKAHTLIKKARSQNTISTVAAIVGGGLIGIPLGQSRADRDPNWMLAYVGGGIATVGIVLSFNAINNANKGVDTYNLSLKSASAVEFKPEFKVIANGNGIGFSMNF